MSLLFEKAVDQFDIEDAVLHIASSGDLEQTGEPVPVEPIATFAGHHKTLRHPDEDWICIPLHGQTDAEPTAEFVGFSDHEVRGPIFLVEDAGDLSPIPADEFAETALAQRIRFWHSDYLPDEKPPGYDAPIDDQEPPCNPVDSASLLDGFAEYVSEERTATRETSLERGRHLLPRTQYEQNGDAIPSLDCLGDDGNGEYRFRVDLDPSLQQRRDDDWAFFIESEFGIHEGNDVLLHAPEGETTPAGFPVETTVERIRGLNIWLTLDWEQTAETATVGSYLSTEREGFGLSHLLNPVPFDREQEAIATLRDHPLRSVLAGERPVTFSHHTAAQSDQLDPDLNQEQQLAVEYALLADDLFCIHGPPGTGKTRTLLEIIRRTVQAGEDVLVCADSNQAVDNMVVGSSTRDDSDPQSLHAYSQHGTNEFTLNRVNAERSASDLVRGHYSNVSDRADVVAATNSSAATLAREFDLLVLDEATQATCTASCIPLARANRVVLAGDHRQLPPFSATEEPPDSSYGLSLFEHLYADDGVYEGVGLQLKTQYRMHSDIAYFSNREFYDRNLRNGRTVDPLDDHPAIEGYNVGGHVTTVDHSKQNKTEGRLVVHLVQQLTETVPLEEIGVITPYAAQASLLREYLGAHIDGATSITVDTIDSFQGSEKTAMILSLVRSNSDGEIGFLGRAQDGPRRLNVALTRAKRYCAVVGDFHTLRYDKEGKCVELFEDFYDYFATTGRLNDVDPDFIPVTSSA